MNDIKKSAVLLSTFLQGFLDAHLSLALLYWVQSYIIQNGTTVVSKYIFIYIKVYPKTKTGYIRTSRLLSKVY